MNHLQPTKTLVSVKIDTAVKTKASAAAQRMGLTLSAIINAMLSNYAQTEELHLSNSYRMTPYLERIIETAKKDEDSNSGSYGPFKTAAASIKFLRSKKWK